MTLIVSAAYLRFFGDRLACKAKVNSSLVLQKMASSFLKIHQKNTKTIENPPSPTISSSSFDLAEAKMSSVDFSSSSTSDHETDDTSNIFITYGVPSTSTNQLSWTDINNAYDYTQEEIAGAKLLQFELFKLLNIKSAEMNKHLPPFEMLRYFLGCSNETDRAIEKWKYSMKMYKEYAMNKISDKEIFECFETLSKSVCFGGYDKDGCRIIIIKYALFFFKEYKSINVFLLAGFYLFYYLTHDVRAHRNGVTLLCDLNGFSLSNFSFIVEKTGIHFCQKVLPIRIKKVFVLDAPWIAHHALKLVLPLLNEKLRKRVFVVTKKELYHMQKVIHETALPKLVNGTFDEKFLNENEGKAFLNMILSKYFTKTISLKHFDQ